MRYEKRINRSLADGRSVTEYPMILLGCPDCSESRSQDLNDILDIRVG